MDSNKKSRFKNLHGNLMSVEMVLKVNENDEYSSNSVGQLIFQMEK